MESTERQVYPSMKSECPPPTYFIILGSGRVGSNYLRSILDAHSLVGVHGEIFDVGQKYAFATREQTLVHQPQIRESACRWLENVWFQGELADPGQTCLGFKVFYSQPEQLREPQIWKVFKHHRVKVFHLHRNLYHKYISEKLAMRSGQWIAFSHSELIEETPLPIDVKELEFYFRNVHLWKSLLGRFLKDLDVLELPYEELVTRPEIPEVVAGFLGLPVEPLSAYTIKQHPGPPERYVANHEELKEAFRGSAYEKFFQ